MKPINLDGAPKEACCACKAECVPEQAAQPARGLPVRRIGIALALIMRLGLLATIG